MAINKGTVSSYVKGRTPMGSSRASSLIGELFMTKMLSNPNYATSITLPNSKGIVTGFCEGPFAFQGKSDWKPIVDISSAEDAAAAFVSAGKALASTQGNLTNEQLAQLSFKQIRGTEMRYAGSGNPVFQMKLILPSYDANAKQSPLDSVRMLMACVYPEYVDTAVGKQQRAPLGYGIKGAEDQAQDVPLGTVIIKRGKFFYAPQMLIQSVSTTFSQEVMTDGFPLYVEANIEFIHWRTPDYATVMSWFKI